MSVNLLEGVIQMPYVLILMVPFAACVNQDSEDIVTFIIIAIVGAILAVSIISTCKLGH